MSNTFLFPSPIQWVLGVPCQGLKGLGREGDHSLPSSDEAKNDKTILLLSVASVSRTEAGVPVWEGGNVIILQF